MSTPTPVATYGPNASVTEAVRERLLPEFDIVHTCLDLATAEAELPLICAGETATTAASGLGSNAKLPAEERKVPKVVFFGGGIPDSEIERVSALVKEKAPEVSFLRVSKMDVLKAGAIGPNPDVIAKIYREKMAGLNL